MSKLLEQAEAAILAIIDEHVAKATSEVQRKLEYAQQEFEVLKTQSTRNLHDATAELRSMQRDRDILRGQWSAAVAERDDARQELSNARAGRDALRGAVDRWHDSSIKMCAERDQARAELAGVAAQRDAHLSRSVELAARVTELESKSFDVARLEQDNAGLRNALASEGRKTFDMRAEIHALEVRLATATSAVDEVDDFRVGDLVEHKFDRGRHARVSKLFITDRDPHCIGISTMHGPQCPSTLTRKPVEVGDTVRFARVEKGTVGAWRVTDVGHCHATVVSVERGVLMSALVSGLVAIASTVKT